MGLQKRRYTSRSVIACLIFSVISPSAWAYGNKDAPDLLGWISDPHANLCQGYFSEPPSLRDYPIPPPITQSPTKISFTGPGVLSTYGRSTISQNVVVSQPGRIATADKAIIYRSPTDGHIDYIRLEGHVQVREQGRLVVGPYTTIRFDEHTVEVGPSVYHFYEDPEHFKLPTLNHAYDAWGTAEKTLRDANGVIHLTHATYTTCAPTHPSWQISAATMVLDQEEGFGTAHNMLLRFYDYPILYMPLYTFPISDRRKTGFLTPDVSYESNNGLQWAFPYYWNLAPNYDWVTTPKYIETRGPQFNSEFRYLASAHNNGQVYLSLTPDDTQFGEFRSNTLSNPPNFPIGVSPTPYLNDLGSYSNFRGFLHLNENGQFENNWTGHLQLNYVTDDYYFQDFSTSYGTIAVNQLLNQADTEYQSEHWNFMGLVQGYQTLHIIGQAPNPALDQYSRLPELDMTSDYANLWGGTDFSLSGQSVNFAYDSAYNPTTLQQPIGERIHLRPGISRPFYASAFYITPKISLDSTEYAAQLASDNNVDTRPAFNASRNLPIVNVDSGAYLDRPIHWEQYTYLATLEPHVFYLYAPLMNQNKYPNFDSELLPFTFPQLFDVNRFTSYDRIENANQFSFGLSSRLLNSSTDEQKLRADFGFGYYLQSPQVCLDAENCNSSTFQYISPDAHLSPLVGQLTYNPWRDWASTASYAYDTSLSQTNNAQMGINYNHNQTYIFTVNYLFVREQNGDPTDSFGLSNNTNLIASGAAWPLTQRWSGLAYGQYNISKDRPDSYYAGLQYDSCCWTFRVIASRSFKEQNTSETGEPVNIFKNSYYVQLQLKSLGNIGTSPGNLLNSTLSGFSDPFK